MNVDKIRTIIEAIIFASEQPVTLDMLAATLEEVDKTELGVFLEQLVSEYRSMNRPFHLVEVAGGWQFRTKPEYGQWIHRMAHDRPTKLSRASLETLAVIAYKQPITRPEVEDLRGVDSGAVVKNLLDRNLIRMVGRRDGPGKPVVYGTTTRFLEVFSLKDLGSLPTLRDMRDLEEGADSGQLVLPVEAGEAGEAPGEPRVVSDSERRKLIRDSVRGLLSVPIDPDSGEVVTELPPPVEGEDEAMAELEAAMKRRKEVAERAEAVFADAEKDFIDKISTPLSGEETPAPQATVPAAEAAVAPAAPAELAPEAPADASEPQGE
jgi:segregation and condensation protein B